MIAGDAMYRHIQMLYYFAESFVTLARFILHKIASGNNCVWGTCVVIYALDDLGKGVECIYAAHGSITVRMEMRVRDVEYADGFV